MERMTKNNENNTNDLEICDEFYELFRFVRRLCCIMIHKFDSFSKNIGKEAEEGEVVGEESAEAVF